MNFNWYMQCIAGIFPRYACFCLLFIFSSMQANELQDFIVHFFRKWDIKYPVNEEFSIKFSRRTINSYRYIVCIPRSYLYDNKNLLEDLFSFIAEKSDVKEIIKNYLMTKNDGWIYYAIDYSCLNSLKKKAYFDFGKNSGKGIDSYEWQAGDHRVARRIYTNLTEHEAYVPRLLSQHQRAVFNRMKPYLNLEKTLLKQHKDTHSLCFAFKNDVLVSEVKSFLFDLMKGFGNNTREVEDIFCQIGDYKITWVYIQKEEVTIYYRKQDWVYHA